MKLNKFASLYYQGFQKTAAEAVAEPVQKKKKENKKEDTLLTPGNIAGGIGALGLTAAGAYALKKYLEKKSPALAYPEPSAQTIPDYNLGVDRMLAKKDMPAPTLEALYGDKLPTLEALYGDKLKSPETSALAYPEPSAQTISDYNLGVDQMLAKKDMPAPTLEALYGDKLKSPETSAFAPIQGFVDPNKTYPLGQFSSLNPVSKDDMSVLKKVLSPNRLKGIVRMDSNAGRNETIRRILEQAKSRGKDAPGVLDSYLKSDPYLDIINSFSGKPLGQ